MPYGVDDLADDCVAVLQAVGYERGHYLGLSHSGVLGQAFALRHPDRLDRLALTMTTPGRDAPETDPAVKAIDEAKLSTTSELAASLQRAQAGDPDAVREVAAMSLCERAVRERPELVEASVRDVFGPTFREPADARQRFWSALARFSSRGRLGDIEAPTLVMTGGGDRMVAIDDSWTLWREIPKATLAALDGVGHDWEIEAPELGASIVRSFLRGELDPPD